MKKSIVSLSWFSKLMIILFIPALISMSLWVVPFYIGEEILEIIPRCWGNEPENHKYMYAIVIASALIYIPLLRKVCDYTEINSHRV